jgi:hypothetical protein
MSCDPCGMGRSGWKVAGVKKSADFLDMFFRLNVCHAKSARNLTDLVIGQVLHHIGRGFFSQQQHQSCGCGSFVVMSDACLFGSSEGRR